MCYIYGSLEPSVGGGVSYFQKCLKSFLHFFFDPLPKQTSLMVYLEYLSDLPISLTYVESES